MLRARARIGVLSTIILLASAASATPYWIAWEGNDYPENEGWTRMHGPAGAQAVRTLAGGVMTIDGIQGAGVFDGYLIDRPGMLNPAAGETFVMQWRVRIDSIAPPYLVDPGVAVLTDDAWLASFVYYQSHLLLGASPYAVPFQPDSFHAWEFRSDDMRSFDLYLDGTPVLHAGLHFHGTTLLSRCTWGDSGTPSESKSTWDYFRFGVIPEPRFVVLVALTMVMARPRWSQ